MTSEDFDNWRARYATMTDIEHIEYANRSELEHPFQQHFSVDACLQFLSGDNSPVLEIGGWKGELAARVLSFLPIESWTNVEISRRAVDANECTDPRFRAISPTEFRWWRGSHGFTQPRIVMSHTIEHIAESDVRDLIGHMTQAQSWYIEAPLNDEPIDWSGYHGGHILEVGWNGVDSIFSSHGYTATKVNDSVRVYRRQSVVSA